MEKSSGFDDDPPPPEDPALRYSADQLEMLQEPTLRRFVDKVIAALQKLWRS